jgi:hypothetical protein
MGNDVGMVEDEVGMVEDEVGMVEDEVGMVEDEVGMVEDEEPYVGMSARRSVVDHLPPPFPYP